MLGKNETPINNKERMTGKHYSGIYKYYVKYISCILGI